MNFVILSTAEWSNPFWTNKQHVAVELARQGHNVLYIDSQGIRKASTTSQDIKRILSRLFKAFRPPYKDRGVYVWSPIPLPFRGIRCVEALNRSFLSLGIRFWSWVLKIDSPILWTYSPLTTRQLASFQTFSTVVYHCVDNIKAQPGMPHELIRVAEQELLSLADFVFVTSPELKSVCSQQNDSVFYYPNVVDFEHVSRATDADLKIPAELEAIKKKGPVLGFIGAVSGYKVDFELLEFLARRNPEFQLVLIGKIGEGDPWTNVGALRELDNVHFMGPRPYAALPAYLKGFDVALLPCPLNDYTKAMFPMKFFEYLAAGVPVVSVMLDALKEYENTVGLAADYPEFEERVRTYLTDTAVGQIEAGIELASQNTYRARMQKMLACMSKDKK